MKYIFSSWITLTALIQPKREKVLAAFSFQKLARKARARRRESSTMVKLRRKKPRTARVRVKKKKRSITMKWLMKSARISSRIPNCTFHLYLKSAKSMAAERRGLLGSSSRSRPRL